MGLYLWVFAQHRGVNTIMNHHRLEGQKSVKSNIVFTYKSYNEYIVHKDLSNHCIPS
jgi:uncharacterized membrane protein